MYLGLFLGLPHLWTGKCARRRENSSLYPNNGVLRSPLPRPRHPVEIGFCLATGWMEPSSLEQKTHGKAHKFVQS